MTQVLESPQIFLHFGPGSHWAEQAALDLTLVHKPPWFQGLTLSTLSHSVLLADWQGRKMLLRGPVTCWSDITSSVACRIHYTMARNVCRTYPDSPVFPDIHDVLVLLKDTLLTWKLRNSFAPEYLILMNLSHSVGVFVSVWARGWL
jgi:hypothetical protein